jgi:hypothetical protein
MRTLCVIFSVSLLAACSTPRPIVDTASLVAKMSGDMDRTLTKYVGSLKAGRESDARILQELSADADVVRGPIQEQRQIMALAEETRSLKILNSLAVAPAPDPLLPRGPVVTVAPTPVSFNGAPLKAVGKIASDIAKPRSSVEELAVLLKVAQIINEDLRKAAEDNKTVKP